jgi:uncharacterized cupin superfamily protein
MPNVIRIVDEVKKEGDYIPENIVEGSPTATTNNQYTDPTDRFSSGVWASTPGVWSFEQKDFEEFCYLIEGVVKLTHENGESNTFKAGDAFVIPVGMMTQFSLLTLW